MKSIKKNLLQSITRLENRVEQLRQKTGVSQKNETLFQAPRSMWSATDVVVEADGDGGAKLLIVEGNYPSDYTTHTEQRFNTENDACEGAERLVASPTFNG